MNQMKINTFACAEGQAISCPSLSNEGNTVFDVPSNLLNHNLLYRLIRVKSDTRTTVANNITTRP
jgi:hypothetical protein